MADRIDRRNAERVSIHVGGAEGSGKSPHPQWLGAHLRAGDEVVIRIIEVIDDYEEFVHPCSFCGAEDREVSSLIRGLDVGICYECIASFDAFLKSRATLPLGASIQDRPHQQCSFCGRESGDIAGLLVRNGTGICAECLRSCSDLVEVRY